MLTPLACFTNFMKSLVGAGVLALPYAILRAGVVPSLFLLAVIWAVSVVTTLQLCTSAMALDRQLHPPIMSPASTKRLWAEKERLASTSHAEGEDDVVSYMQLSMATFGESVGAIVAWVGLIPSQWVIGASFQIFINVNVSVALGVSVGHVSIATTIIGSLMCVPRTMDYLAYTSTFGNFAFVVSVGCIVGYAVIVPGIHWANLPMWGTLGGFFEAFGVMCFTFSAHPEALSLSQSANPDAKKHMTKIIVASLSVAFVIFTGYAFLVLAAFGVDTKPIVFANLPPKNAMIIVIQLSLSAMLQVSYPIIMFPIFHILETTQIDAHDTKARLTARWTITLATGACAWLFMDYFEPVVAIVGGLIAFTAYVLPPLFHLQLKDGYVTAFDRWTAALLVVFGLCGSLVAIYGGFNDIIFGNY